MSFIASHLASSVSATSQAAARAVRDAKASDPKERTRRKRGVDGYDQELNEVAPVSAPRSADGNTDEQTREDRLEHPGYDRPGAAGSMHSRLDLEA